MTTLVVTASEGNTGYPQVPVGMHNARCIKVIGLGTQKQEFSGGLLEAKNIECKNYAQKTDVDIKSKIVIENEL